MQVWAGLWSINNAMSKQFYLVMSTETLCRQCVSPYIHTYISKVCVYILICHRAVTYVIISQVLKLHVWYVMILLKNLVTYYHMCILQGNMFIDVRILHKIRYVHCRYMYLSTDFHGLDILFMYVITMQDGSAYQWKESCFVYHAVYMTQYDVHLESNYHHFGILQIKKYYVVV